MLLRAPLRPVTGPGRPLARRTLLAGAAALLGAPAQAVRLTPALPVHPFPHGATLLLAGPRDGLLDGWSRRLAPALARAMPPGPPLHRHLVGGGDGVTAANRFATATAPDGETALMMPGEAARAWAVGDARVHYEVGQWVPVLAGLAPGVLVGRGQGLALRPGQRLTLAAASPVGADLPAFLALDLLRVETAPLFGLGTAAQRQAAFAQRAADLVFLQGQGVAAELAALRRLGGRPIFSLGVLDATGRSRRDPLLPRIPDFAEFLRERAARPPEGALAGAFAALAASSRLAFGLALPGLTQPALVALWRLAGRAAARDHAIVTAARDSGLRLVAGPVAIANLAALAASTEVLLGLRHFLATRLGWHPH